ncbi:MAG TPA: hypothetical protein VGV68_11860 [Terriglobia bacterium]|nr:hypothetical protein [Terriglobia bacterium]
MGSTGLARAIALLIAVGALVTGGIPCFAARQSRTFQHLSPSLNSAATPSTSPQAKEKSSRAAKKSSSPSQDQSEGCTLLPYKGTPPMSQFPPYPPKLDQDVRGGMICKFIISPNLPLFTFHFLAQGDNPLGKIEITEGKSKKVIQTIPYPENAYFGELNAMRILEPLDANFDGYKDLPLLLQCGATGNCTYDIYLYDQASNRFVRNSFLSGLTEPIFHPENKRVDSFYNMSAGDWDHETYEYQNGHFTLIRKVESEFDREKGIDTQKTYELRNGKLELTNCDGECPGK